MKDELRLLVGEGEKILYEGKPNKACFIFECILNPFLSIALLWGIILFAIFYSRFDMLKETAGLAILIPFFLFFLLPVWIYLFGILFSIGRYKNSYYIVTDFGIYVSEGIFTKSFNNKPFAELSHVYLHRGIFDQMFNVGDIITTSSQVNENSVPSVIRISSVSNYTEVYNLIKKLQKDIYTDVMYPNDKRPTENHGYKTEYKG